MSYVEGKVFTVTGGASGMGLATCRMLAQRNAKAICIADYNDAHFEKVKAELEAINGGVTAIDLLKVDVSSSEQVATWVDSVLAKHGSLDGCVNAAGVAQAVGVRKEIANILAETDQTWRRTMGANIDGVFYCTREQVRVMLKSPKAKLPRSIVNIGSMASMMHTPDAFAYGASKAAVAHLSTSIAKDVLKLGIRVNTILPGMKITEKIARRMLTIP
jgi:chanoclavine-I dehydrogenase